MRALFVITVLICFAGYFGEEYSTEETTVDTTFGVDRSSTDNNNGSYPLIDDSNNSNGSIIIIKNSTYSNNGSSPTNGDLNSICMSNYDCKVNGSRCDKFTNRCQCLVLLVPLHGQCVNPTPISHDTIWIINHYVDLIIGLSITLVALGSLLAPIKGKLLGERIFFGVRDKLRASARSHNSCGHRHEEPLSAALDINKSNNVPQTSVFTT